MCGLHVIIFHTVVVDSNVAVLIDIVLYRIHLIDILIITVLQGK